MDLHDGDEGSVEVVAFWLLGVENFDWESTTGDGEDGTAVEVFGKLFGIKCGRGNDDFQVRAALDCL